jgi:hypothetical protein
VFSFFHTFNQVSKLVHEFLLVKNIFVTYQLHKNCKNPIVIEDVAVEVVPDVLNVEIIPEKAKTKRVQKETVKTKRVQKVKEDKQQCHCIKANNERCTNNAIPNSEFCGIHSKNCKNPIK